MRHKEALDGAVEYDNLYVLISFECRDDLVQLRNGLGPKDIQGRMVKRHSPVEWRTSFEADLSGIFAVTHVCLPQLPRHRGQSAQWSSGVRKEGLTRPALSIMQSA